MTICIAMKLPGGVILSTDSASTISSQTENGKSYMNTFYHSCKLKHFKDYPLGIMTWGIGNIGSQSSARRDIVHLIRQFEETYLGLEDNRGYEVKNIASDVASYVYREYLIYLESLDKNFYRQLKDDIDNLPELGLFFAGYSDGQINAEMYSIRLPISDIFEYNASDFSELVESSLREEPLHGGYGPCWFGCTSHIVRLLFGLDPDIFSECLVSLKDDIVNVENFRDEFERYFARNANLEMSYDLMPIQDGLDFVSYLMNVVIGIYRFRNSPAYCGGPISMCVITQEELVWINKNMWKSSGQPIYTIN